MTGGINEWKNWSKYKRLLVKTYLKKFPSPQTTKPILCSYSLLTLPLHQPWGNTMVKWKKWLWSIHSLINEVLSVLLQSHISAYILIKNILLKQQNHWFLSLLDDWSIFLVESLCYCSIPGDIFLKYIRSWDFFIDSVEI